MPSPLVELPLGTQSAQASLTSVGSPMANGAIGDILRLLCAGCSATAAALVVMDGDREHTVAVHGVSEYGEATLKGLCPFVAGSDKTTVVDGKQLQTQGVKVDVEGWQDWLFAIHRAQLGWNGSNLALWIARRSHQPFEPETLRLLELGTTLAIRELSFDVRHRDIVVQRERATLELAEFHEHLQRQHGLYRELAKHLPNTAVLVFDSKFRVLICEGWAAAGLSHFSGATCKDATLNTSFTPAEYEQILPPCERALKGQSSTLELQSAGQIYELSIGPVPHADNRVEFGILVVRNVTESRREQRHAVATAIRLEALVESLDDGILVEDENRRVHLCSNRLRDLMQLDQISGQPIPEGGAALMKLMASICFIPEAFEESTIRQIEAKAAERNELVYMADMRIIERDYVPLFVCDKHIGHLWVYRDVTQREQAKDLLQRQADELRALSLVDELTGLYNRRGFLTLATQQLKLCDRTMRPALVVFVDLDGMKRINDELGHEFGDQALIETANVLRHCFRYSDVIARLGGDEFVALAIDVSAETHASIEERLMEALARNNEKPDRVFQLQFSIGVAPYDPASAEMIEEVLARADALMYEQKRARRAARTSQ